MMFQDETYNLQRIYKFLQIHIYSQMIKKKKGLISAILIIFYNKHHSKNRSYEKKIGGKRTCWINVK
jgi:hypothetical protein